MFISILSPFIALSVVTGIAFLAAYDTVNLISEFVRSEK